MSENRHITVSIREVLAENGSTPWEKFVNHCFRRGYLRIDSDNFEVSLEVDSVSYISEIDGGTSVRWFNRMCRLFEISMKNHGITVDGHGLEWEIESRNNFATMRFSLLKGRTEIADYIYDDLDVDINFRYYDNLVDIAREKVHGLKRAIVYVKGPTLALVTLQDACKLENVQLELWFYDHDFGWTTPDILKYYNHESR